MPLLALTTIPDIVGTGATVPLSLVALAARWVRITAPAGNTNNARFGDVNTAQGRGAIIAPGKTEELPPLPLDVRLASINSFYQLNSVYVYIHAGDSLSVTWGN